MTENHDYETPERGRSDWHVPLNENFARLDADVEVRGTEANLDAYTPHAGAKFLAADTGAVYLADGTDWSRLGTVRRTEANVFVRPDQPDAPAYGDLWIDRSGKEAFVFDGETWNRATGDAATTDRESATDSEPTTDGEPTIVEDGEGDLSAYAGDTGYFGITGDAISGSGSVVAEGVDHGGYRTIVSTDDRAATPDPGDTIAWEVRIDTDNTYAGVLWGVQSTEAPWPGYRLRLDTGETPGVDFEKIESIPESFANPQENHLSKRTDIEPEIGTVYTVRVEWREDGSMPYEVRETETGSLLVADESPTPDTEYTGGGVGFMGSSSWSKQSENRAVWDDLRIE